MLYTILDIETTGGKYNEEGITEIAIYRFDGLEIVDQFISLINPERPIQPFVVNLTGINNNMLRTAPKFYEVAKRIVEITQDTILVAHNALFDYRILRTEFSRLGFEFDRSTLCTVTLSQELLPEQPSYSLGKLVRSLGIPLSGRHRADGDAQATLKLFKLLLSKDLKKTIISAAVKVEERVAIGSKFLEIIDKMPSVTGLYYAHQADGKVLYIGKSRNIKKRVTQHFTRENRLAKQLQARTETVTYEHTGSDLIALLKENEEIRMNRPKFNRRHSRILFTHALYQRKNDAGFIELYLSKADGRKSAITTFSSQQQGANFVKFLIENYQLCYAFCAYEEVALDCSELNASICKGACENKESPESYNKRVVSSIEKYSLRDKTAVLIDRGRTVNERSAILIEKGIFKGFCYYDLNYQLYNLEILHSLITPMESTKNALHLIQTAMRKNKRLKVIPLENKTLSN